MNFKKEVLEMIDNKVILKAKEMTVLYINTHLEKFDHRQVDLDTVFVTDVSQYPDGWVVRIQSYFTNDTNFVVYVDLNKEEYTFTVQEITNRIVSPITDLDIKQKEYGFAEIGSGKNKKTFLMMNMVDKKEVLNMTDEEVLKYARQKICNYIILEQGISEDITFNIDNIYVISYINVLGMWRVILESSLEDQYIYELTLDVDCPKNATILVFENINLPNNIDRIFGGYTHNDEDRKFGGKTNKAIHFNFIKDPKKCSEVEIIDSSNIIGRNSSNEPKEILDMYIEHS